MGPGAGRLRRSGRRTGGGLPARVGLWARLGPGHGRAQAVRAQLARALTGSVGLLAASVHHALLHRARIEPVLRATAATVPWRSKCSLQEPVRSALANERRTLSPGL